MMADTADKVVCPRCGSSDITFMEESSSSQFGAGRGCAGCLLAIVFLPLAILSLIGLGSKKTKVVRICKNCNNRF